MKIRALLATLALVMTAPAAMSAASTDKWRLVAAPHFQVYSELGERQTAAWIRRYDLFITATLDALAIPPRQLPPLTVVLFARDRTYAQYKLTRPNGRTANVAGQFSRMSSWSVIGLAMDNDDDSTRQTIYHEGTHWLMSADPGRQPAWFSEGIAEMLATFDQQGDTVSWAKPIAWHLGLLRDSRLMPLRELLVQANALSDREDHTDLFYAQAWAFVHFLMMSSDAGRRQQLTRFLEVFRESSGETAVGEAFGADLAKLEKEFASYTRQSTFGYITRPAKAVANLPASVPATPADVETALGLLAFGAERWSLAREHATRSVNLAPGQPGGHEILAYLADQARDSEALRAHADAALSAGSRDPEMHAMLADALMRSDGQDAVARSVKLYEQAISLNSRDPDLFRRLSETLLNHQQPAEEDRRFLERGLTMFPGNDWLRVGHAATNRRLGQPEAALATLTQALRPGGTLEDRQRDYATSLRRSWVLNDLGEAMDAASRSADFAAARALVARHGAEDQDPELRTAVAAASEQLVTRELYARLEQAQRNRRAADIPQLVQDLLARPDLPADLRSALERMPIQSRSGAPSGK